MSTRWPGGIINGSAPVPTGGGAGDLAPGVWTIDQADQYIATQTWPGTGTPDPQFQYVTALLHGDGTNGGQNNTFLDSSSNNFTITRNGNTTQGSFSPYGDLWSNFFDGTGDFLQLADNAAWDLSGNYTIECFFYITSTPSSPTLIQIGSSSDFLILYLSSASRLISTAGSLSITSSIPISLSTWNHVALVRNGTGTNNTVMYINGQFAGQTTDNTSYTGSGSNGVRIGAEFPTDYLVNGYISNVRIVNGSAVYTSAFAPITTPLTAVTNTVLLTCQANRIIDSSVNNLTVTKNGDVSVQRFSPFQNLATYTPARVGGSGYFDGTGDNLATSITQVIPTGSFTVECWAYVTGSGSNQKFVSQGTGGSAGRFSLGIEGGNWFTQLAGDLIQTGTPVRNQWNYVAVTYNGSTITLFVNGTSIGTVSSSANAQNAVLTIGQDWNSYTTTGYIASVRVSNTVRTVTAIPLAPFTSDANTTFLSNFTNGAIFDSDATNNLETVGNAQISTSVVKYGTGSMAFDGSGDSLKTLGATPIGTANATVEFWLYPTSSSLTYRAIFDSRSTAATDTGFGIFQYGLVIEVYGNGLKVSSAANALTINTWQHVALSRVSGVCQLYINGLASGSSGSYSSNLTSTSIVIGDTPSGTAFPYLGYIDDLRITNGYARYWYPFQPPTAPFPNYGGVLTPPVQDPIFDYNTLLLNGDGTNGAQNNTFLDSSTNNFTITRNGNTTQGSFSPYGDLWSNYFDGTGDNLSIAQTLWSANGNATFEAWVYVTNLSVQRAIFNTNSTGDFCINTNGTIRVHPANSNFKDTSGIVPLNAWTHVALVQTASNRDIFINGVLQTYSATTGSPDTVAWSNPSGTMNIGQAGTYRNDFIGYFSNVRVSNTAVYSATFTPSTTPLTAISGTLLLTCQSNRFRDASSNNYTVTANGNTSVQRFSPFNPTAPYSTSVIGGSGYFDGSGDFLTVPDNAALNVGTGDFCLECWFNRVAVASGSDADIIVAKGTNNFVLFIDSSAIIQFGQYGVALLLASTSTATLNSWFHVAVTRSGTTLRMFINGVQQASTTSSANFTSTTAFNIGIDPLNSGQRFNGYISNLRLVKGSPVYTSNFTPSTVPLTNITNTSLLTNMTNAGIPDLAMQNNLETVGNAQVSTSVVKYGTGSLAFDGSGDWLAAPPVPQTNFGFGDFTIECWLYRTASGAASDSGITSRGAPGNTNGFVFGYTSANVLTFNFNYSGAIVTGSTAIPINTWTHVAVTRNGNTFRLFVNGAVDATATSSNSQNTNASDVFYVGRSGFSSDRIVTGYIDDLRITRGIARYVQPFTPPTAALQTF